VLADGLNLGFGTLVLILVVLAIVYLALRIVGRR
jgi:cbb3-type cytochrome oxidase subunit 3